jgi:hypothetical protein
LRALAREWIWKGREAPVDIHFELERTITGATWKVDADWSRGSGNQRMLVEPTERQAPNQEWHRAWIDDYLSDG